MNDDLISRSALLDALRTEEGAAILGNSLVRFVKAKTLIEKIPAVDAVEVIHCKDCFYWMKAKVNRSGNLVCPKSGMEIVATDYCSRAEKRKCHYDR